MALLCISLFSYGQCDYTLEMNDSYGDGWNGNSIDVLVDGNVDVTPERVDKAYNKLIEDDDLTINYTK